jgi:hypothetical protein
VRHDWQWRLSAEAGGPCVDGGVSPFNNPALQALMYATISGYRINWPMGENNILLVSVGTGAADSEIRRSEIAAAHAFRSLLSLLDDVAGLQETLLQWISASPRASKRDSELGTLEGPENMRDLHRLGIAAGERDVLEEHFSNVFDLPSRPD